MESRIKTAKEIGQRLRRIRMARNMSQQALADLAVTSPQNISKYEKEGVWNIETIQRLSEILGHNLMTDETDAEGSVGVIGMEILYALIESEGILDVDKLSVEYMHGMSDGRITNEIFKLERIGLCVREQYRNHYGMEKDSIFITAKGLICYQNQCASPMLVEKVKDLIPTVTTLEERLRNKTKPNKIKASFDSYQELLDSQSLERMIRTIPETGFYREGYIQYLKRKYQSGPDMYEGIYEYPFDTNLPSFESCYEEIMFRMAAGIPDQMFEDEIVTHGHINEMEELEQELATDPVVDRARKELSSMMENLENAHKTRRMLQLTKEEQPLTAETMMKYPDLRLLIYAMEDIDQDELEKAEEYWDWCDEIEAYDQIEDKEEKEKQLDEYRFGIDWAKKYFEEAIKHPTPYPMDWYSDEEILKFVKEQMYSEWTWPLSNSRDCNSDEDSEPDSIKTDAALSEINVKYPETKQYYRFPERWEESGLADQIREHFHVPADIVEDEIDYFDEEGDFDEENN